MSSSLTEIAQQLQSATHKTNAVAEKTTDVKVQLIYAFNGYGKTRLSRAFKELISPKLEDDETDDTRPKILYYNAYTEDLFYWNNDLEKLNIQPNTFTDWILRERGDTDIVKNFQRYTNDKLTPLFQEEDIVLAGKKTGEKTYPEVTFSLNTGTERSDNLKISKGEESIFIWSIFYSLIDQVIETLNVTEPADRETNRFDKLEYIFIDDPVSSLDENHMIELAVDLAQLIKSSQSKVKFIITTHNPLFYNVLHNELSDKKYKKYILQKHEDGEYELKPQSKDSPFSYHLHLKTELEKAIGSGQVSKYHFNFIRNILEKTATFFGHENWGELLPKTNDGKVEPYQSRIINISSHSKHAGEETSAITDDDKRVLGYLAKQINKIYLHEAEIRK